MKTKTIRRILRGKTDEWLETIEDESVRRLATDNTIITGGCIASMLLREHVNDYDVYFRTYETACAVAGYYVAKFLEDPPPRFLNSSKGLQINVVRDDSFGRVKITVKSAGVVGESSENNYQYFEQVSNPSRAEEFV